MAYVNDYILDNGITALADGDEIHILSAIPTSYAEAVSLSLGNKTSPVISAPADGDPDGRSVEISAFADGTVNVTGTAVWWALLDTGGTRYLAGNAISPTEDVVATTTFSFSTTDIRIPDAT